MDGVCDYDNETIESVNKELNDIQDSLPKENANSYYCNINFFNGDNEGDDIL